MFFENISITSGQLNTGVYVAVACADVDPPAYQGHGDYRPSKIYVENKSGVEVGYGLMTSHEYGLFTGTLSYSNLKPLANSITDTYTSILGEIAYVIGSGSAGHTGGLNFYLVRE